MNDFAIIGWQCWPALGMAVWLHMDLGLLATSVYSCDTKTTTEPWRSSEIDLHSRIHPYRRIDWALREYETW
jgi:hypothetical protein